MDHPVIKLRKSKQIEASHFLPNHDGKCKRLHGHTYTITLEVSGAGLNLNGPKAGMLFDYHDMGIIMKEHIEILDHKHLNDYWPNPTSEIIAQSLFKEIGPHITAMSNGNAYLSRVLVSETQMTEAEYGA